MPTYDLECIKCNHNQSILESIARFNPHNYQCELCQSNMKQVILPGGVNLKTDAEGNRIYSDIDKLRNQIIADNNRQHGR